MATGIGGRTLEEQILSELQLRTQRQKEQEWSEKSRPQPTDQPKQPKQQPQHAPRAYPAHGAPRLPNLLTPPPPGLSAPAQAAPPSSAKEALPSATVPEVLDGRPRAGSDCSTSASPQLATVAAISDNGEEELPKQVRSPTIENSGHGAVRSCAAPVRLCLEKTLVRVSTPPLHPPASPPGIDDAHTQVVSLAALVEGGPRFDVGSATCPSEGSAGHSLGLCKPCDFVSRGFCRAGVNCHFCHLCGPSERKRWKQERKKAMKALGHLANSAGALGSADDECGSAHLPGSAVDPRVEDAVLLARRVSSPSSSTLASPLPTSASRFSLSAPCCVPYSYGPMSPVLSLQSRPTTSQPPPR